MYKRKGCGGFSSAASGGDEEVRAADHDRALEGDSYTRFPQSGHARTVVIASGEKIEEERPGPKLRGGAAAASLAGARAH